MIVPPVFLNEYGVKVIIMLSLMLDIIEFLYRIGFILC